MKRHDKIGKKFNKLTVLEYVRKSNYLCECECGNKRIVYTSRLTEDSNKRSIKMCEECMKKEQEKSRLSANDNFFSVIDTEEKAYIVGFLAADGYIRSEEGFKIALHPKDVDILYKIKDAIETKSEIKCRRDMHKLNNAKERKPYYSVSLYVYNKQNVKDLEQLGVIPNKSSTLKINFDKIPKDMRKHLLRGYFDGDGTLGTYYQATGSFSVNWGVVGNKEFILQYKEILEENLFLTTTKFFHRTECNEHIYNLSTTSRKDFLQICEWLYSDATIYLDRKYETYLDSKRKIEQREKYINNKLVEKTKGVVKND